jgi:transposase
MIQVTPQMRVLLAIDPVDFRRGIDGLAQLCRAALSEEPMSGAMFVFRSRSRKSIKLLVFDGQGFWLCQKRMSSGCFRFWPKAQESPSVTLRPHEIQVLLCGGDFSATDAAPIWKPLQD